MCFGRGRIRKTAERNVALDLNKRCFGSKGRNYLPQEEVGCALNPKGKGAVTDEKKGSPNDGPRWGGPI